VSILNGKIFADDNDGSNPYDPDNSNVFKIPIGISKAAIADSHGQIEGQYLDELFDYFTFEGGSNYLLDTLDGMKFDVDLEKVIIEAYVYNAIDGEIKEYEKCIDDGEKEIRFEDVQVNPDAEFLPLGDCEGDCDNDNECAAGLKCFQRNDGDGGPPGCGGQPKKDWDYCYNPFCSDQLKRLYGLRDGLSNQGLSSIFFDESIALLFGNKTTIGQVCSYSRGLEAGTVDAIPGFCCLDAPYQADDWGETVSNDHYLSVLLPLSNFPSFLFLTL